MRAHYDFSNGIRGKYTAKIDTTDIRRLYSTKPVANGDLDGEIRRKRGDTLVGTLRKIYGPDFAPGVRSDTRLDTLRKRAAGESLLKLLTQK